MEKTEHLKYIDEIYEHIINAHDEITISGEKNLYQGFMEDLNSVDSQMCEEDRKRLGSFYTDSSIVEYMLGLVLDNIDITENPYIRILDPSCGCGYFLTGAYDILKKKYEENLIDVNRKNPELKIDAYNIHEHILKYNLFGADIDEYGVKLSVINLMLKQRESCIRPKIICCDSLLCMKHTLFDDDTFLDEEFDIIVGNPPYVGHKKITGQYRRQLQNIYGEVFQGKSDIFFCFLKSSIDRLNRGGRLCFITSRYFLESPSGREIRSYIMRNCSIKKIIDFYGIRVMKGISVDPVIIYIEKDKDDNDEIDVVRGRSTLKKLSCSEAFEQLENGSSFYFRAFIVPQGSLKNDGWVLWDSDIRGILDKIEKHCRLTLSDVCESFQGIITGCDRAFIVDDSIIGEYGIERDITRRWIKSSQIKKYHVEESSRYIIYSDLIDDPSLYLGVMSYIYKHKAKLENRRECIKGFRKWYQLQWGRDRRLFEMKKIVFPYKSRENRFAIDEGNYSSADVYGMYIKPEYCGKVSYEYLCGLLNSRLYEFYFKSFGKKLGEDLYDYYPNTVMRLMIPDIFESSIIGWVSKIISSSGDSQRKALMEQIDRYIYDIIGLSDREIEIVERGLTT